MSQGHSFSGLKFPPLVEVISKDNIMQGFDTVYWFMPYKSSDFPEIICDKNYFFIYSTDHHNGDGGIFWGKGNNLDCSDFVEVGKIIDGYQAETPHLYRFPNETRTIALYYHTSEANPLNVHVGQETNVMTTSGGVLNENIWTHEQNPLGYEALDHHLGYFKFWNIDGILQGMHLKRGAPTELNEFLLWQRSVYNGSGYGFTRSNIYDSEGDYLSVVNRALKPTYGTFFKRGFTIYYLGTTSYDYVGAPEPNKQLVLLECNSDLSIIKEIQLVNPTMTGNAGHYQIYIEGDYAHCYMQSLGAVHYSKIDISEL
ncbi:hypothetical protein KO504_17070 [Winogradskyella psychrotolerans]|uniref:hypothetical protein n=1 Tax=Winogradskyella psychrotolerans TaxID=1344585 RepID=UPI001C06DCA5|nr:hypothetical protein [Winogradskyella psychrotolerans]MBU2923064.1 hypothetical protein [Winogradskyella psychrotolerans]